MCSANRMHFVMRMDRDYLTQGDGHDAEDVDEDSASRFFLFERKHTHVPFLEKMMKRKKSPELAVQCKLVACIPLAVHVPGTSSAVEELQSRRGCW